MIKHRVSFIFYNLDENSEIPRELELIYEKQKSTNFVFVNEPNEVLSTLKNSDGVIFIFRFETKREFIKAMSILKVNQKLSSMGLFKALCITDVKSDKVLNILNKYNCTDIVPLNTKIKTLRLKLNLWEKSILNSITENDKSDLVLTKREVNEYQPENVNLQKLKPDDEKIASELKLSFDERTPWGEIEDIDSDDFEDPDDDIDDDILDELDEVFSDNEEEFSFSTNSEIKSEKVVSEVENNSTTKDDEDNVIEFKRDIKDLVDINVDSGDLFVDLVGKSDNDDLNIDLKCRFESFFEDEVVVEVPPENMVSETTLVEVCIKFVYNKCRVELILDGEVTDCERTDDAGNIVTIKLNRKENDKLDHFMLLFQERQENVTAFLALAKGH